MSDDDEPPILDYATPARRPGVSAVKIVLIVIGSLLALAFVASLLMDTTGRAGYLADRVRSASNLRQIGQAILLYTNDHGGEYPDSFLTILLNEDITSEVFVSPSSSDTAANGPTTQAVASQLNAGGHLSYVYLGKGLSMTTVTPDTVVAYEKFSPSSAGTNVLFGDGHVDWDDAATAAKITAKIASGKFPVTMPAS